MKIQKLKITKNNYLKFLELHRILKNLIWHLKFFFFKFRRSLLHNFTRTSVITLLCLNMILFHSVFYKL